MAHIVTNKCVGCKFTDCVEVCPVACFYEHEGQLVIHPEDCIDCTACVAECPVEAITPIPRCQPSSRRAWNSTQPKLEKSRTAASRRSPRRKTPCRPPRKGKPNWATDPRRRSPSAGLSTLSVGAPLSRLSRTPAVNHEPFRLI